MVKRPLMMLPTLPTHLDRRHLFKILPAVFNVFGAAVFVLILGALVIYGLSVYVENQVLDVGRETRALEQDNQDLQIQLDRLRSYQKVADSSSRIQGLQIPDEVVDVVPAHPVRYTGQGVPERLPPREAYGY